MKHVASYAIVLVVIVLALVVLLTGCDTRHEVVAPCVPPFDSITVADSGVYVYRHEGCE